MELIQTIPWNPEKIKDLSLLERIIQTLEFFSQKHNKEYVFEKVQEFHLGGYMCPAPKGSHPGGKAIVLKEYDIDYFKNIKRKIIRADYS